MCFTATCAITAVTRTSSGNKQVGVLCVATYNRQPKVFSVIHEPMLLFVFRPEGDVSHGPGKSHVEIEITRRAPKDHVLQRQGGRDAFHNCADIMLW